MTPLEFQDVTFSYDGAEAPSFDRLTLALPRGWTGIIGANGGGKTTLLRLACGELAPRRGVVRRPFDAVYCDQRTDAPPNGAREFIDALDAPACALRGRLGVCEEWVDRWATLSHGERKRVQIAVALWRDPQLLALDEPTNHVDPATRVALVAALRMYDGVGLLVSHDRELLDALCRRCVVIAQGHATLRPGNYTQAAAQHGADRARRQAERSAALAELRRLEREAAARRREAAAADRRRSKRGLGKHDHSAKAMIDAARVSGKDGVAGRKLRQMEGRVAQAAARVEELAADGVAKMGVRIGGCRAARRVVLRVDAGDVALGDGRTLAWPELVVENDARIALTGANGAGKSTLVRLLLARLDLPAERVVYVAQELDAAESATLARRVRALPAAERGAALSHVSRLGSSPAAVLASEALSPGESRKVLLALGLAREPHLVVMDEPTNHLDLPSIECVEAALAAFDAALLVVSHDARFLARVARASWRIEADAGAPERLRVRVDAGRATGP
ncbi:MAG: ATP-binding cassette domain-containing protein [Phycisphaerae bacterium]